MCAGAYLLERQDAAVLLGGLGPARAASAWLWAINKRAFEIVYHSLAAGPAVPTPGGN